jgi:hypothetical protein
MVQWLVFNEYVRGAFAFLCVDAVDICMIGRTLWPLTFSIKMTEISEIQCKVRRMLLCWDANLEADGNEGTGQLLAGYILNILLQN